MNAAIYARYSSDNQREESITAQLRAAEQYCSKKSYTVVKQYKDEAKSGKTDKRPEFQQMVLDAKLGLFDRLIVHKVDRFSRDPYDSVIYKRQLNLAGVTIEYVEHNFDPNDNITVVLEGLLVNLAQYYSLNLADETMKGLKENAYQAKFNGGYAPFGFEIKDSRYVVNEYESQGVKVIYDMYLQGKGYKDILSALQLSGYKTRQGKDFAKNSLSSILANEKYMGTYTFNKIKRRLDGSRNSHSPSDEIITMPDAIPAIISQEQFEAAQQKMKANSKRPGSFLAKHQYLLSSYIKCGECDAAMQGKTSSNRGKLYHRYYCGSRERKVNQCDNPGIGLIELEDFVLDQIKHRLLSSSVLPELLSKLAQAYEAKKSTLNNELDTLKNQRSAIETKINNILNFIENGNISDTLRTRLAKNEKNLAIIDARVRETHSSTNHKVLDQKKLSALFTHYQGLINKKDPDSVRVLINTFLEQVTVHKDYVDVALKISVGVLGAREGT